MARRFKEKAVKVIEVKPVDADDGDRILTYDESNDNASLDRRTKRLFKSRFPDNIEKNRTNERDDGISNKDDAKYVQKILDDTKNKEEMKIKLVHEMDTQNTTVREHANDLAPGDYIDIEKEEKRKKKERKKKKKKKKSKKKEISVEADVLEAVTNHDDTCKDKGPDEEITEVEDAIEVKPDPNTGRKLPCIFGFISSWIAKRRERRRAKKRKAIEKRQSATPVQELVEYEHKQAKGGVAFTLEVDSRPMRLPVLPPIKQRPGSKGGSGLIVRKACVLDTVTQGTDEKLKNAELKRFEEIEKRKRSSKNYEMKRTECQERKLENEFYFKQKADLTMQSKQCVAKKNRTRLQEDRRCSSPMLRAPSTLPPLRVVRVKPFADVEQPRTRTVGTQYDPVDEIFKF